MKRIYIILAFLFLMFACGCSSDNSFQQEKIKDVDHNDSLDIDDIMLSVVCMHYYKDNMNILSLFFVTWDGVVYESEYDSSNKEKSIGVFENDLYARDSQILNFCDNTHRIGTLSTPSDHLIELISNINFENGDYYSVSDYGPMHNLDIVESHTYSLCVCKEKRTYLLEKFGKQKGIIKKLEDNSALEVISTIHNEPLFIEWSNKHSYH